MGASLEHFMIHQLERKSQTEPVNKVLAFDSESQRI